MSFEDFFCIRPKDLETKYNFCIDCDVPMAIAGAEYECLSCGFTCAYTNESGKDHSETMSMSIRISTGSSKGRMYNASVDYTKTQKKFIGTQLRQNYADFAGKIFPRYILHNVTTQYNDIQKLITEDDVDEHGQVRGQKKFVRRGNIKDEVLAALIYFECVRAKIFRKKKDIAAFMKLNTNGFSRGEDILRTLEAEGKIDIKCDVEEPIMMFVTCYMEAIGIDNADHADFVADLVTTSEQLKIGMNSQLSSKIVGALWVLVNQCAYAVTAQQLEQACDNTKKNTFTKFSKLVMSNKTAFKPVFLRHGIAFDV